ncbi:MAG TPA: XRE family transcriptional regulator [Candidatus Binataceae bacterium]|nr:XRE family transcriptional regulator [Candidatus Binataceae bacterium]
MAKVPVQGAVLKWAREFRGLSLDEAAPQLGLTAHELEEIEAGTKQPSLTQFEKFGTAYRLPRCTLFRKTPPQEPPKPTDFRTIGGVGHRDSFDFSVAESRIRSFQSVLRLLRSEDEDLPPAELRHYDSNASAFTQGDTERNAIGVSVGAQLGWKSDEGFRRWRAIIEHIGVAVYLQKFSLHAGRAFSLWEKEEPPAIIINKTDPSANAWTHSLIHEYAHLLIRKPGLSDLNPQNPIEAFCNRFAAAFLMPIAALKQVLPSWPNQPINWDVGTVRNAAGRLKVSARALAIRLEELNKASSGFNKLFDPKGNLRSKPSPGQKTDFVRTRLSELGGYYTESVIGALDREVIDIVNASQALGFSPSPNSMEKARKYLDRYRELASVE